jgi:hypothetical protein
MGNILSSNFCKEKPTRNLSSSFFNPGVSINQYKERKEQEGFLRFQTPTSTVRLKIEGFRVKNNQHQIESEELMGED